MRASSSNRRWLARRTALVVLTLGVAGCGREYEIDRPGTWRPTGANEYNLRAMVADQRDLSSGAAALTDRGNGAARAVTRLYVDRRRALLNVSLSKVAPASDAADTPLSGGGGGTGGAAGGTGGSQ